MGGVLIAFGLKKNRIKHEKEDIFAAHGRLCTVLDATRDAIEKIKAREPEELLDIAKDAIEKIKARQSEKEREENVGDRPQCQAGGKVLSIRDQCAEVVRDKAKAIERLGRKAKASGGNSVKVSKKARPGQKH